MMLMMRKEKAVAVSALMLVGLLALFYFSQQVDCAPNGRKSKYEENRDDLVSNINFIQHMISKIEKGTNILANKPNDPGKAINQEKAEKVLARYNKHLEYYQSQLSLLESRQ